MIMADVHGHVENLLEHRNEVGHVHNLILLTVVNSVMDQMSATESVVESAVHVRRQVTFYPGTH